MLVYILATVVAMLILVLYYVGVFYSPKVRIGKPKYGSMYIAYKYHMGRYSECGPHFGKIAEICPKHKGIGIYYDDPKIVDEDKCHYIVGVIISDKSVCNEDTEILTDNNYQFAQFPAVSNAIMTEFPFRTLFTFLMGISAGVGAYKVYPALEKFGKVNSINMKSAACIEIYEDANSQIHYMLPLNQLNEFFVPEAKDLFKE